MKDLDKVNADKIISEFSQHQEALGYPDVMQSIRESNQTKSINYDDTHLKKLSNDIVKSQKNITDSLENIQKSSNTDRKINIAILIFTFLSLAISFISLIITLIKK